jgi:hypothetical protein
VKHFLYTCARIVGPGPLTMPLNIHAYLYRTYRYAAPPPPPPGSRRFDTGGWGVVKRQRAKIKKKRGGG